VVSVVAGLGARAVATGVPPCGKDDVGAAAGRSVGSAVSGPAEKSPSSASTAE
jgi:hypothetical protein